MAVAYGEAARLWQEGPGRLYDRLAEVVVGMLPVPLAGRRVLDLGAGTGAATRAAQAAGARVIAVDIAFRMLATDAGERPPAAVADAVALPFPGATFDAVLAAFSLNHLADPAAGLAEAARVLRPGGDLMVTAYATGDGHPVKEAVEGALADRGWASPDWYELVKEQAMPCLATVERARDAAAAAGLADACAEQVDVAFPDLGAEQLVAWRLGMAHSAGFVAELPPAEQGALVAEAVDRLGDGWPVLVRSMVVLTARAA